MEKKEMELTLEKKLGLGFGVILLLMVFSAGMTYFKLSEIKQSQDRALDIRVPSLEGAKDLERDLNQTQNRGRQAVLAGEQPDRRQETKGLFEGAWNDVDKDVAGLDELAPKWADPASRDRLNDAKKQLTVLRATQQAAIAHSVSGAKDAVTDAGKEFTAQGTEVNEAIMKSLGALQESFTKLVADNREELLADNRSISMTMGIVTLLGLCIGIVVALFVGRGITGQVNSEKQALDALLADTQMLVKASAEGKLSTRADAGRHQGAYGEVITGVNRMLDAILLPIGEGNRVLAQISAGKVDEMITETYKGDHEKMKQAVNNIAVVVQNLQKEMARLAEASREGQLSDRGKPEQFQGAYAEIVRGVNTMLDAILLPIAEGNRVLALVRGGNLREKVEIACKGDHAKMKDAINGVHAWLTELIGFVTKIASGDTSAAMAKASDSDQIHEWLMLMKATILALQKEMLRMSDFAKAGQLSERANPDQFKGAYAEILKGVNTTLDAILVPTMESNRVLVQISNGKTDELVAENYKGDHEKTKLAVNSIAVALQNLQKEMLRMSDFAKAGQLSERANPDQFKGGYAEIVKGVNTTLDAVVGPLNMAAKYVDDISKGQLPVKITETYNGDFNKLKLNLNACIDGLGGLVEANQVLQLMAANDYTSRVKGSYQGIFAEVGKATNQTADTLRGSMEMLGENVHSLSSAAEELTATSQQMSANAEETSAQTKVVSAATLSVSQNLQTVATGAEEMGASIKEIAKNATEAAKVATSAVKVAETANTTVSKLGDSSAEIGQVIKVITSIAQQTNLLALNATIEAARAGEAGKGFAVVANEVKELAKETAKATEDISRKIEAIQTDTKAAVDAIGTISEVINQINGISSTIATAVEEQNATTNEMSRNVSDAARGSGEITSNIAGVAQAAESTSHGASDTQKAAQDLVETSKQLRRLVEQFKINSNETARGGGAASPTLSRAAHVGS
jgi:methyl-accepting chemotaxis protein